ncbi:unnamed protein product [Calypogeia fissa]
MGAPIGAPKAERDQKHARWTPNTESQGPKEWAQSEQQKEPPGGHLWTGDPYTHRQARADCKGPKPGGPKVQSGVAWSRKREAQTV